MSDLVSIMVASAALYTQGKAKSFKEQTALNAAYQQGFKDYKKRSDAMFMDFWEKVVEYEKARTGPLGRLAGAVTIRRQALERMAEKIKAEIETEL